MPEGFRASGHRPAGQIDGKGEVVVLHCESLPTGDIEPSDFPKGKSIAYTKPDPTVYIFPIKPHGMCAPTIFLLTAGPMPVPLN